MNDVLRLIYARCGDALDQDELDQVAAALSGEPSEAILEKVLSALEALEARLESMIERTQADRAAAEAAAQMREAWDTFIDAAGEMRQ